MTNKKKQYDRNKVWNWSKKDIDHFTRAQLVSREWIALGYPTTGKVWREMNKLSKEK